MNDNNVMEEREEGKRYYAVFVCIDYVDSTKLIERWGEEEAGRRINFYRDTVDRIFENFKGVEKGWSGEGNFFFFFYSDKNKAVEDNAVQAAMSCIAELRTGINVEIFVRISIGSGVIKFEKDLGRITSHEISLTGHINSACPENSILITENVYFGLSEELRSKFKICGTTKRDNVLTFLYPAEKKEKINKDHFLDKKEDWGKDYFEYIKFIESSNKTLLVTGVRQIEKIPTLDLEEGFFQLRLEKTERKIFDTDIIKKSEEEKKFTERKLTLPSRNFIDVLKTDKYIVVLGDPGSGKTTLLKYIALIYSRGLKKVYEKFGFEKCLLPVIVPVSGIYSQTENKSFVETISDYYKIQGIENTKNFIKENLDKGKCMVLLDGLDEIPAHQGRFSIARNIENFMRRYSNNRFIITSRIIGYEKINRDSITEYYVSLLDDNEIREFVYNWFTAFEKKVKKGMPENAIKKIVDDEARQLMYSINEDENIKDLARNPFLLSLICPVQKSGYKLPRHRIELYKTIAETLFETWVMARSISIGKPSTEVRYYKEGEKVLAPLALWMHENLSGGVEKEDKLKENIIEIMKNRGIPECAAINTVDKFFKYLAEQTQLIIPKGKDYYGFRHLSFEEFLAARALIMKEKYNKYLKKYSKDPRWTEVFLLVSGWIGIVDGREEEITRIVEDLLKSKDMDDLLLAGRIVAEDLGVKKDVGKEVIGKIGDEWLFELSKVPKDYKYFKFQSEKFKIIKKIFEKTLLRDDGKETYEKFIDILKDKKEDGWVRVSAAFGLSSLVEKDESIRKFFVDILKDKKEDGGVRRSVAYYLSSLVEKDESIRKFFVDILKDKEEDGEVRKRVAIGLSSLVEKDESIRKILVDILKDKKEVGNVRGIVAYRLSSLVEKDESIRKFFVDILKDKEEDGEVRGSVAHGLSSLVEKDESIRKFLVDILKDKEEDGEVRGTVAYGLSSLVEKDESIRKILVDILKDKKEVGNVRGSVAHGLSSLVEKDESIRKFFVDILKDKEEDGEVRKRVAIGLSSLVEKDESIRKFLVDILKDKKEVGNVRGSVAHGLSSLVEKDESIRKFFVDILKDKEEYRDVRKSVAYGLYSLVEKDESIRKIFVDILKDKKEVGNVRGSVAHGLSSLVEKDESIRKILVDILKDKKEVGNVRGRVARGLSSLVEKDESIRKIFVDTLKDKEEYRDVRISVAHGLSSLVDKDESIRKFFVDILKDKEEDGEVRRRVAHGLPSLVKRMNLLGNFLLTS